MLATFRRPAHWDGMTKRIPSRSIAIAGAVGSAAVAAALLYVNRRNDRKKAPPTPPSPLPGGDQPETD